MTETSLCPCHLVPMQVTTTQRRCAVRHLEAQRRYLRTPNGRRSRLREMLAEARRRADERERILNDPALFIQYANPGGPSE